MRVFVWLAYFPSDRSNAVQLHDSQPRAVVNVPSGIAVRDFLVHYRVDVTKTKFAWLRFESPGRYSIVLANLNDPLDFWGSSIPLCASEKTVCCALVRCRVAAT